MTPLMEIGYKAGTSDDQLYDHRREDTTENFGNEFLSVWNERRIPVWRTLFKVFGRQYCLAAVFKMINDLLSFAQPQLLRLFLSFIASYNSYSNETVASGLLIAVGIFTASFLQTICMNQYLARINETGMRMKAALTAIVYDKAMTLSNTAAADHPVGAIINHVAVDTQWLQMMSQSGHQLWSAPFQLTICLISLYLLVGWTMLAGVCVMVLAIPLNSVIIRRMQTLRKQSMKNEDSCTKLVTEILSSIKGIKLLGWQPHFMATLRGLRSDKELKDSETDQHGPGLCWLNLDHESISRFLCYSYCLRLDGEAASHH